MPRAERLVQILALREGKNARCISDAVSFENDAAVVNRVVRKENRFEHFRGRFAIHHNARLDDFLKLDRLLDGDERADASFG